MRTIFLLCLTTLLFALEQNSFRITHNPQIKPFYKESAAIPVGGLRVDADVLLSGAKDSEILAMEGEFVFSVETKKELFFDLTWAKALLYIDNKEPVVIEKSTELLELFEAGKHSVKIKVLSSMGAGVAFVHVGMREAGAKPLSDDELKQKLDGLLEDRDVALNYIYHFRSKTLLLKESGKESILFVSSLRPAIYTVKNIKKAKLKMIVYSGAGVEFKCDDAVEVVRVAKVPQAVELYPDIKQCSSFLGGMICPNEVEFRELNSWLASVANRPLDGFSHPKEQQIIPIPAVVLDEKMKKKIDLAHQQVDKKRSQLTQASEQPYESGKRWFEMLKIKEKDVPQNSFRAFYMTKHRPDKVAYSEAVKNISLDYSHKLFHGIAADDFLALWVGDFYFDKDVTQEIGIAISWAKVKITDNGEVIYEGSEASAISHKFSAGEHRIEVEYINNYGQVDVNIGFSEPLEGVADGALNITPDTAIYLFGSYESRRSDHKAELFLKNSAVPTVLFLTSYETINYDIKNSKNAKLKAVVCNSYEPVGEVKIDGEVPVYRDKNLPFTQRIIPFSFDAQKLGFEGEREFANTVSYIKKFAGKVPDGFSSTETPAFCEKRLQRADESKAVLVPQIKLDEKTYKKIDEFVEKLKQGVAVESADCR